MDLVGGIVAYVVIWTIVLFMVLPFGVRQPDETETGHMPGAPENPRIGLKFLVTTGIAAVVWLILDVAIIYGLIGLPGTL
jgi:predicted secreted protein